MTWPDWHPLAWIALGALICGIVLGCYVLKLLVRIDDVKKLLAEKPKSRAAEYDLLVKR